jgi:hypothetical protein
MRMMIGFFENNRFEENSQTMASTPTGYYRAALPHVNPRLVMPTLPSLSMHNDRVYGDPEYSWREYITKM